jgi:tRNA(Ile)-lysidine synthase
MALNQQTFQRVLASHQVGVKNGVLVALSGGVDSIVLCDLLFESGISFSIAHVNYGLRADESDKDELFVESIAKGYGVAFYSKRIKVDEEVLFQEKGTQEAARTLRYEWFEELLAKFDFSCVMTAHHQDDQAETILFQFVRGGLISALRGMKFQNGNLLRPLLAFTREEILNYATSHNLSWREDSSNAQSNYTRNFIRHKILPELKNINPTIVESLSKRTAIFEEMERLISSVIQNDLTQNLEVSGDTFSLNEKWVAVYPYKRLLFWAFLETRGFSSAQMDDAIHLIDAPLGARLESASHVLWKERGVLVLSKRQEKEASVCHVEVLPFYVEFSNTIHLEECRMDEVVFDRKGNIIFLDLDKLTLPLILRRWSIGDKFIPLGMQGHQLVSDFLIQQKIPQRIKPNVCVLVSNDVVAAIVGFRPDERFKIDTSTTRVLRIIGGFQV